MSRETEMQPLGRKSIRFPNKTDCHPPKGYLNWWEVERPPSKRSDRQATRQMLERVRQEAKALIRHQHEAMRSDRLRLLCDSR